MTELAKFSLEEPYHVVLHWGAAPSTLMVTTHSCDQVYCLGRPAVGTRSSVHTVAMPAPEVAFYSDAYYIFFGEVSVSDGESSYLFEVSGTTPDHDL